jgi:hypothetical protein
VHIRQLQPGLFLHPCVATKATCSRCGGQYHQWVRQGQGLSRFKIPHVLDTTGHNCVPKDVSARPCARGTSRVEHAERFGQVQHVSSPTVPKLMAEIQLGWTGGPIKRRGIHFPVCFEDDDNKVVGIRHECNLFSRINRQRFSTFPCMVTQPRAPRMANGILHQSFDPPCCQPGGAMRSANFQTRNLKGAFRPLLPFLKVFSLPSFSCKTSQPGTAGRLLVAAALSHVPPRIHVAPLQPNHHP